MKLCLRCLLISTFFSLLMCDEDINNFRSLLIHLPNFDENSSSFTILFKEPIKSLLSCLSRCLISSDCETAVICDTLSDIMYCFRTKRNVYESDATVSSFNNCRAIPKFSCKNNGIYYDGMCHCISGFTGKECGNIVPGCCENTSVKSSSDQGSTLGDLITSINRAEEIKFLINEGDHDILYTTVVQGYPSSKAYAWMQSFNHIVIDLQNRQNFKMIRVIKDVRTDSYVSTWQMSMDIGNTESQSVSAGVTVEWISTRYSGETPCSEISKYGIITQGSLVQCSVAIKNGSDVHINTGFSTKVKVTFVNQPDLKVNFAASIGHSSPNIIMPSYWYNSAFDTGGTFRVIRWNIHQHKYKSGGDYNVAGKWFIDEGWHEAYIHDSSGLAVSGSLSYLKATILNGRRIRVKSNNMVSELQNMYLVNEEISGSMFDFYDEAELAANKFQLVRSAVSTSGNIISCTFLMESDINRSWWTYISSSNWYVESRPWVKTISFNSVKEMVYGNVSVLFDISRSGKSIRVVIRHLDDSYQAFDIMNIHLFNTSYIVLDTGTHNAVVYDEVDWLCQQWAGFLATDGVYETVKWTAGRQVIQTRVSIDYISVDVFCEH